MYTQYMKKLIILTCLLCAFNTFSAKERYVGGDHYNSQNGKFFNPGLDSEKSFWDLAKWLTTRNMEDWPEWLENEVEPKLPSSLTKHEMAVTFINHSSFLLQFNGLNILTDPVYSERTSPVSFVGPKRVRSPGLAFERLPKIDIVMISHNHYDHMDLDTLKRLDKKFSPKFLVPMKDGKLLKDEGIKNVAELDWWASHYFGEKAKITFTPAQHFSGRGLFDRNKTLWGSYIIKYNGYNVFFAGDTGYSPHFKEIKYRFQSIDFSILPIGAYKPRWFMKTMHMNPAEAVTAHTDLESKKSIGMHFGTFQLTEESIYAPIEELQRAKLKKNINANDFTVMSVGQTLKHSFVP